MSVIKPILQHAEHVVYFSGANNYCWAHFRNGDKKLLAKPISFLESQLAAFIRVHKTVLLNPIYVQQLFPPATKKMAGRISLRGGTEVPVSRRRWQDVVERLEPTPAQAATSRVDIARPEPLTKAANKDIILVMNDMDMVHLIEQTVRPYGPTYQCRVSDDSRMLLNYLQNLRIHEQPLLLLVDARTAITERLHLLTMLKTSSQLCHLPVVLLVSAEATVVSGYQQQANCVLSFPTAGQPSSIILERMCQYWFQMASLPQGVQMVK